MKNPFFSVIIPVYNVEKYLERCIESVLAQDFSDYEMILVDDGSKDTSPQICDCWAKKESKIRVIHKDNEGLGMARNSGLKAAKGSYIFFFDSDDYIRQGLLRSCKSRIDETSCDAVFFGLSRVNAKGKCFVTLKPNPIEMVMDDPARIKNELFADFITKNPYTGRNSNICISVCCSCLSRSFLEKNELLFVSERKYISEDIYFFIELFNCLTNVAFLNDWYYCYCQNAGSLTFSYQKERFERLEAFYKDMDIITRKHQYSDEVRLRLKESFIAHSLGCLKMEAGNANKEGFVNAYRRVKKICMNPFLYDAFCVYPSMHLRKSWLVTKWCILNRHFLVLYLCLLIQYKRRGI